MTTNGSVVYIKLNQQGVYTKEEVHKNGLQNGEIYEKESWKINAKKEIFHNRKISFLDIEMNELWRDSHVFKKLYRGHSIYIRLNDVSKHKVSLLIQAYRESNNY